MQTEQASLEEKNRELGEAYTQKSRAQQKLQQLYQSLKAQVMATHVANAAGDEADSTLHIARGDRFVDRLPGTRTSSAHISQLGPSQQRGAGHHIRTRSGSSASSGQQRASVGFGAHWNAQLHGRGPGSRMHTGRTSPLGIHWPH